MIKKQINPHDKFFKEVFSRKKEVEDFIKGFLPKNIVENIQFEKLKLDTNSYIDDELKESFADVVYNCFYGEQQIKITLLFEHKSYQDNDIHLQLMQYMLNIWRANKKQKSKNSKKQGKQKYTLIPILPIVVYHGKSKWQYKQFYEYFDNIPSELIQFIPNFNYLIKDLHTASRQEIIENYQSVILQTSFLVMKDIFNTFALLDNIVDIFKKIYNITNSNYDKHFISVLFYYLYNTNTQENYVKLRDEIKQLPNIDKDMITMADVLRKEGRQEGRQEGILKGVERTACVMLLEEFDVDIIQRSTKLSLNEILELQKLVKEQGAKILDNY